MNSVTQLIPVGGIDWSVSTYHDIAVNWNFKILGSKLDKTILYVNYMSQYTPHGIIQR